MRFLLDGVEFRPKNSKDFSIKLDFTKSESTLLEVSTDRIRFELEAMDRILIHLNTIGPFEGIPLGIEIGNTLFDFYVDLSDKENPPVISRDGTYIEASIKKRKGKDSFMMNAKYTTWQSLRKR